MVEAMYEQSPSYFKQFVKDMKFCITTEKPCLSDKIVCYAFGRHDPDNVHVLCPQKRSTAHYHLLIDAKSIDECNNATFYEIKCLYSTFVFLIFPAREVTRYGALTERLSNAVMYNESMNPELHIKLQRKPAINSARSTSNSQTCSDKSTQTDFIPSATLDRMLEALNGRHAQWFNIIIDIINSGYGRLENEGFLFVLNE